MDVLQDPVLLVQWPVFMFLSMYSVLDIFTENHFKHFLKCVSSTELGGGIMNMNKHMSLATVTSLYPGGGETGTVSKNVSVMVSIRCFVEVGAGNSGGTKEEVIN